MSRGTGTDSVRPAVRGVRTWCAGPRTRHEGPFSAPRNPVNWTFTGADDGIRTRDPNLGKVVLYQLSHVRAAHTLPPETPGVVTPGRRSVERRHEERPELVVDQVG